MPQQGSVRVVEPDAVTGQLAVHLARTGVTGLPGALALLVSACGLRSAVLREAGRDGAVLAVAGEVVRVVAAPRGPVGVACTAELPVRGPSGAGLGTLCVVGVRPGILPVLRGASAVLALTLEPAAAPDGGAALLVDAERDRAALADALHDGPVQDLLAARYAADLAAQAGAGTAPDLAVLREGVQQALTGLRRTMWQLRPRGDADLAATLTALSDQLTASCRPGLRLRLRVDTAQLSEASAGTAYRLVQAVAAVEPAPQGLVVELRREDRCLVVELHGVTALPDPGRWRRAAHALGGYLSCRPGSLRLTLPEPPPAAKAAT